MTRLIIARHGNTFAPGEPVRRIGARTDLPLTESGIAQSTMLGRHLHNRGTSFELALCGSLQRTTETARLILQFTGQPLHAQTVAWLDEIDHGPDEGQIEADVVARLGLQALAAWDKDGQAPCDWLVDPEKRVAAWRRMFAEAPATDTLLVTSNGASRYALLANKLIPSSSLKLRTGAYGEMIKLPDGNWRVSAWDVRP